MRFASFLGFVLLASSTVTLGCSSGQEPVETPQATGASGTEVADSSGETTTVVASSDEVRKVPSASLPPTDGMSPAVDGGRLQVPLLSKWFVPARTSEWLFRLQRDRKTAYPQILITVDESFEPTVEKLNKSNIAEFVPVWQKHLLKSHEEKVFGEPVSAVRIGKRYGAECLIHSAAGKMSVDQLMVTMVGAGRVYTLELRVLRGTLEDYRMDFYAVVAGTTIEAPAETPGGFGPMKQDPAEEPQDTSEAAAPPAENEDE